MMFFNLNDWSWIDFSYKIQLEVIEAVECNGELVMRKILFEISGSEVHKSSK